MNENQRPESMDEIFSKENIEFLCQYKVRSRVLRALRQEFDVKEMLVISEKKVEKPKLVESVQEEALLPKEPRPIFASEVKPRKKLFNFIKP